MSKAYLSQVEFSGTMDMVRCQVLRNGRFVELAAKVVIEKELAIVVNEERLITASITPGMDEEFVTGYLFGQGFIDNVKELESVSIEGNTAKVMLKDFRKISRRIGKMEYRVVSGGGKSAFFDEVCLPKVNTRIQIEKKDIFRAMNTVLERASIYKATEGTHAVGLFTPEATPICLMEDIGRHNTLDKAIGYALMNKIDCSSIFLASTGRMASEMVSKICRAGIPVVATKTAVTQMGLEIGRKCGVTIIGFVRDSGIQINTDMELRIIKESGMKVYTHAERVISG